MTKKELQQRVNERKQEIDSINNKLSRFRNKAESFINGIKGYNTIYRLIKALPIWQELEKLIEEVDSDAG